MTSLTKTQLKYLKGLGHHLNPVILVGAQGISDNLLAELDKALSHHELIKIKIAHDDRDSRRAMNDEILKASKAVLVSAIGKTFILYRTNPKAPKVALPR
ncbi:ribosome assembly RNA-binding protein YhbY [Thiomicrospira cyclica]|jgi:RNA-binding protein|uniref:RNA-binding, CRM domain protein n=1 Tax=Thiomicrospira cyclica (strain DSM 14477 / JCM 11371 / ALM1) TaxID=717773 RepID=F6DC16_THICA|nr:ribosome assembly RNA-binding protein YhbY [Thiomicrospira cyclica]AEG31402.1 RNA-binding, CRM domain protein [Thiomicrospira cyclica ALM1]